MFKDNIGICFASERLSLKEFENTTYQRTVRINYKASTSTGKMKGKHKQSCFIIPYSICSWLVPHFLSSFSFTVLIKFFLIKKSKSSTNLNPQRRKTRRSNNRLKCYDFRFVRKKYFRCHLSLGQFWGGSCPQVYLPEGQLYRRKIIRKLFFHVGNYPWEQLSLGTIVWGAIIQGAIVWGQLSGVNCLRKKLSGHHIIQQVECVLSYSYSNW